MNNNTHVFTKGDKVVVYDSHHGTIDGEVQKTRTVADSPQHLTIYGTRLSDGTSVSVVCFSDDPSLSKKE